RALDFWFNMGVDGLRLDAVPYLYEREGTMCENLPETHAFLKKLRRHVDDHHRGRMLLAEANQWPEDAIAYFGGAPASAPRAGDGAADESRAPEPVSGMERRDARSVGDECHMAFHF